MSQNIDISEVLPNFSIMVFKQRIARELVTVI
jgi:hypothetical protein